MTNLSPIILSQHPYRGKTRAASCNKHPYKTFSCDTLTFTTKCFLRCLQLDTGLYFSVSGVQNQASLLHYVIQSNKKRCASQTSKGTGEPCMISVYLF